MSRTRDNNDPRQGVFGFLRAQILQQSDGTFVIKPGRPIFKLTPAEFGREVGLSADSIYRRIADGSIPQDMVEYVGPRKILIHSPALDAFKEHWRTQRS